MRITDGTPMNPADMDPRRVETLRAIMKALRTPKTGCPWDLEQSFDSIAPYTIEEAYEVADATARGDRSDLCQELGDLLLQPVYHAELAEEEGSFTFDDVVEAVCRKMMRRHPHGFGDEKTRSAKLAKSFWEDSKARESRDEGEGRRTLDGIPVPLPGLTRAVKLQTKAAKVGFDWPSSDEVHDKIAEEVAELRHAAPEERAGELGDLLFALANLARHWGIDPEGAIRAANQKFERRFRFIEDELAKLGRKPSDSSLAEMDELWN